jgi:hypothetical protein
MNYREYGITLSSFQTHELLAGDNLRIPQNENACKLDLTSFPFVLLIFYVASIYSQSLLWVATF